MSYILDALKRADAERAQVPLLPETGPAPRERTRPLGLAPGWLLALGLLLLAAGLAWWFWPRPAAVLRVPPALGAPPAPARPVAPAAQAEAVAPPILAPLPPADKATARSKAAPTPAAPAAEPSVEASGPPPSVTVSGSTYSENPALRMLIVNGKVVQEGQEIAPGLRLEVIGPHSAVINHRGSRFNVNY